MKLAILILFGAFALHVSGCVGCDRDYSDGERAGVVIRLSQKGLLLKSWEGSMVLSGAGPGLAVSEFEFSTRNQDLAQDLTGALKSGKPVILHYKQWALAPSTIDTDHEVVDIRPAQP
jgi:hypothetical protein